MELSLRSKHERQQAEMLEKDKKHCLELEEANRSCQKLQNMCIEFQEANDYLTLTLI